MKAFYCLWPNFEYIDKLVDAGIDTIILTAHDLPWDTPSKYYDTKDVTLSVIDRYRNKVSFLLSPLWIRSWIVLPKHQRWVFSNGANSPRNPCPLSRSYMDSRINKAIWFAEGHKMDGIIWDLEHMGNGVIPVYKDFWKPKEQCYCIRCKGKSVKQIWKEHAGLIKSRLSGHLKIHGQFPYSGGWTMRQYPDQLYHLTEETYQKDIDKAERYKWKIGHKMAGVNPKIVPGAWAEFFTEEGLINYLKHLKNKYGGFWIYSHEKFGNRIPNPHVKYPYPLQLATNHFFNMLEYV